MSFREQDADGNIRIKRGKGRESCKKLNNENFKICISGEIYKIMRWDGYAPRMEETKVQTEFFLGNSESKRSLGRPRHRLWSNKNGN
jgi:hypothetical protein